MSKRTSIIWTISKEELQNLINQSFSFREVIKNLGLSIGSGGSFKNLKKRIEEDKIDISMLDKNRKKSYNQNKIKKELDEIFVENSNYGRHSLKKRLIEEGFLENKCSICSCQPIWNDKPLVMILDHINGINNDNRLKNLRLLCPNCNSQTETFAGRNIVHIKEEYLCTCGNKRDRNSKSGLCRKCYLESNKKNRPDKKVLIEQVEKYGYKKTGELYGVSDNAIRKWLKT